MNNNLAGLFMSIRQLCMMRAMMIRTRKHAPVRLTVDLVILTVRDGVLQVLLVERGNEPFAGELALPGGFMREGEPLESAARRELAEETNLDSRPPAAGATAHVRRP